MTFIIDGEEIEFRVFLRDTPYDTAIELQERVVRYRKIKAVAKKLKELDGLELDTNYFCGAVEKDLNDTINMALVISEHSVDTIGIEVSTKHTHQKDSFTYEFRIPTEEFLIQGISIIDRIKASGLKALAEL